MPSKGSKVLHFNHIVLATFDDSKAKGLAAHDQHIYTCMPLLT